MVWQLLRKKSSIAEFRSCAGVWFSCWNGCTFDVWVGLSIVRINSEYTISVSVTYSQNGSYVRAWDDNREAKWKVEFILACIFSRVWQQILLKCEIVRWVSFWETSSLFPPFSRNNWSIFLDQLQMNECRSVLLFWLNTCLSNIWNLKLGSRS